MITTDPQEELLPIVNMNDQIVGKITRKEAHMRPDIIHRAIAVLVFDRIGQLLIQKRSLTKDTYPGYWSESVGGHVGYDQEYKTVAVREIHEELGILVSPRDLTSVGKLLTTCEFEKEMTQVYRYILKTGATIKSNAKETAEISFIDILDLKQELETRKWAPSSRQVLNAFVLNT